MLLGVKQLWARMASLFTERRTQTGHEHYHPQQFEVLLPLVCVWAAEQERVILQSGAASRNRTLQTRDEPGSHTRIVSACYRFVIAMCRAKEAQSAVVKSEAEKPPPIPISKRPVVFFQVGLLICRRSSAG
jgi:hypothetical protein